MMESNNILTAERKFSKRENRIQKINTTALIVVTIIEALLILALTVQTFITPTSYGKLGLLPLLFLCVGCVLNWVLFVKDKSSEKLKYIMMIIFLIGWGYLMITGVNIFVTFYIFPIYIITILYYDRKFEKMSFIIILSITVIRAIVWMLRGYLVQNGSDGSTLISMVISIAVICIIHTTAKNAARFDDDSVFTLKDKQQIQAQMLYDILDISQKVKEEIERANELMKNLRTSSNAVNDSIEDISRKTNVTDESILTQKNMTAMIDEAINQTAGTAKDMVVSAESSSQIIAENMEIIHSLRSNAETINETNILAADSMMELQEKSKEVQKITEVIISISNQTNLLALNASIESARAGEAGKGFAVVADQIRTLAEKTRKSTEEITGIIAELNADAQNAADIVHTSISSMNQQAEIIKSAAESFSSVQNNMATLMQRIADMDEEINNLLRSNDTIIANISQLSDASRQVSANAKEAAERSTQNQAEALEASNLLDDVKTLVAGLDKYQTEMD